ncbi:MAG: insulinase family protein [Pyrinomonadaceae bacterium]
MRAFHATYYRPDNATLVIAGDFNPAQLDAWVDKYFGRIPRPQHAASARHLERAGAHSREAPTRSMRRMCRSRRWLLLTALPPAASDDAFALEVAQSILSGGESSRLYRALVYEQQLRRAPAQKPIFAKTIASAIIQGVAASGKKVEQIGKFSARRSKAHAANSAFHA